MFALLTACLLVCPTYTVAVANDSVTLVVAIADDLGSQAVSVDSLLVTAGLGLFGSDQHARVAKVAGGETLVTFSWPAALWGPGATLGSPIKLKLAHVDPLCPAGVCWQETETVGPSWSFTSGAVAPSPAPAEAITWTAGLN